MSNEAFDKWAEATLTMIEDGRLARAAGDYERARVGFYLIRIKWGNSLLLIEWGMNEAPDEDDDAEDPRWYHVDNIDVARIWLNTEWRDSESFADWQLDQWAAQISDVKVARINEKEPA